LAAAEQTNTATWTKCIKTNTLGWEKKKMPQEQKRCRTKRKELHATGGESGGVGGFVFVCPK